VTLDAGPLIAFEQRDRRVEAWLAEALDRGVVMSVPAPVVAEVWRGGPRAARVARALGFCAVAPIGEITAKYAGLLLGHAALDATVDALVVASAAERGDRLLTADPDDMRPLADAAGVDVAVL
jgi:predicted nucleic acid-binding protein